MSTATLPAVDEGSPALSPEVRDFVERLAPLDREGWLAEVQADQWHRWAAGNPVLLEAYLELRPELADDRDAVLDLMHTEVSLRTQHGPQPLLEEYAERFPGMRDELAEVFALCEAVTALPRSHSGLRFNDLPSVAPVPVTAPEALPEVEGYELLGELGRGGMGVVYQARQLVLNRVVALKMIRDGAFADDRAVSRFRHEAEAVARLQHPNIVQIFDVGVRRSALGDAFACPYLCLEYVDGCSLGQLINGTPQAPRQAAGLVEALARGMHYAHERGIIHRDLKPANVLLTADGTPKITDFGLAKQLDKEPDADGLFAVGTPEYMAPEQAFGRCDVDESADIFALGILLYELLTGKNPFQRTTQRETMAAVIHEEPPPIGTDRDLEAVVRRCLRKDPARRYPTAQALADDLHHFRAGEPVSVRQAGRLERAWRWARRRPAAAVLALGGALAALLGCTGAAWEWHKVYRKLTVRDAEVEALRVRLREERRVRAELHRRLGEAEEARWLEEEEEGP